MNRRILSLVLIVFGLMVAGLSAEEKESKPKPLITFIELGSDKCMPCKMMKPVMKEVEEKFGDRVEVIFHDVWTTEKKHMADLYNVRLIPTQIFLDQNGHEFFRHEGFYSYDDIAALLKTKGVEPKIQKKETEENQ